jgi:hypothetical protein
MPVHLARRYLESSIPEIFEGAVVEHGVNMISPR